MKFQVEINKQILKILKKTRKDNAKRILDAIEKLEAPFSRPYEKLKGYSDVYRIRVGDYRIIYYVDKKGKIVLVLRVDLRKRVYKGL